MSDKPTPDEKNSQPPPEEEESQPVEPTASRTDDIEQALQEADRQGVPTDLGMDDLPESVPELDEGPRAEPVDEVQEAIFQAAQQGTRTEIDLDELPAPGLPPAPQKVVHFKKRPEPPPGPAPAVPLPDFPAPTIRGIELGLILAVFVSLRFLALLLLRPGGFIRDWSDFNFYFGIAALSDYGYLPFVDFWLEWPPLVPWLSVGAYRLSLLLPPWTDDPRLWFILILGSIFVLFEIGNFLLIYRLARRLFDSAAAINRILWLYTALFPLLYTMLGYFDGIVLFCMLLALELLLADRRFLSALAVGVGIMVKVIPVLMVPVAARRLWDRYRANPREAAIEIGLYGVVCGLAVVLLLAPFIIVGPEWVLAFIRSILNRSAWESVWAVIEGYYGYGVVMGDRLNPAEQNFAVHPASLPWWAINLVFIGLYAFIFTRPAAYSRPRNLLAFAGLTIVIFMLFSKGYSPQFLIYLLPFILLLFPNGRGLTYALIFTGLNVLEQPIYFIMLPDTTWLLVVVVVSRAVLLLIVAVEFGLILVPEPQLPPLVIELRNYAPRLIGAVALAGLLILAPFLLRAYTARRLAQIPASTFIRFMEAESIETGQTALILTEQADYRQLYPYLRDDIELRLLSSEYPPVRPPFAGLETAWTLTTETGPVPPPEAHLLASFQFEKLGQAALYTFQPTELPFIPPARFTNGLELVAHEVRVHSRAVEVELFWRTRNPQYQNLTVFTHLVDADGQWKAGHDSIPANGTAPITDWPPDAIQADLHRISLPPDLPPGEYTVLAGLYNNFNERIPGIAPNGGSFENRAVPLAVVQLP